MAAPEQLNLWDRLFNRYRKEVAARGDESWVRYTDWHEPIKYRRLWVEYRVIDRLTGSETIKRDYLN